jgi:hypothetical protein
VEQLYAILGSKRVEMINLINIILGAALLLAGRKFFWLFVGAVGFVTGLQLATAFWRGPEVWAIIFGLILGVIFALLAIFLQTITIGIAGFLAGAFVLSTLVGSLGTSSGINWITYIIGGVIGLALVIFLFDWAIITLSSLAGASLLVQAFLPQDGAVGTNRLIFFILFIIGVLVQGAVLRSEKSSTA